MNLASGVYSLISTFFSPSILTLQFKRFLWWFINWETDVVIMNSDVEGKVIRFVCKSRIRGVPFSSGMLMWHKLSKLYCPLIISYSYFFNCMCVFFQLHHSSDGHVAAIWTPIKWSYIMSPPLSLFWSSYNNYIIYIKTIEN